MFRMPLLAVIEKELMLINGLRMCTHLWWEARDTWIQREKKRLPVSILGEARCSTRSVSKIRVILYRLALAGDASFWRCRCMGNKISLTRKAVLFTWPTEVSEE